MSFRQYGGINYAARNNIVKNNYTNANNLNVMTKVGQPDSIINVDSGLYGLGGNITFQQTGVPKYGIVFSDGSSLFTANGGGGGDSYWTNINTNDIRNTNSGNVQVSTTLSVGSNTTLNGNLSVFGSTNISNLTAAATTVTSLSASTTLGVSGATTLGSTLGVSGATILGSTLGVSGATSLGGTLTVTSGTQLNSGLTVVGNTNVTGNSTLNGNLTVTTGSTNVQITSSDMTLTSTYPPPDDNSVVTKKYVDNISLGFQIKQACQCATTGNLSEIDDSQDGPFITTITTIDGYTLSDNDRILVKNQTVQSQNGIFVYNTSPNVTLSRASDLLYLDSATNVLVFVQYGTDNDKTSFLQNTIPSIITVGVDNLIFAQFSQFQVSTGDNLTFTSGELNVNPVLSSMTSIQFGSGTPQTVPFVALSPSPSGNYTNPNITVNSFGQITSAVSTPSGGASEWTLASGSLYPNSTSTNVAIGAINAGSDRLLVQGSLRVNNAATNLGGNTSITGTLGVTGATTLSSTLGVTGTVTAPTFSGNLNGNLTATSPTAPTATAGTNTTQIATTAFVTTAVAGSSYWLPSPSSSNIYYNAGNVGIGTNSPTRKLDVVGDDALINGLTIGRGNSSISTNTAIGYQSLYVNSGSTYSTAVGYKSLNNNNNANNTAVGYQSLFKNYSGISNTGLGFNTLYNNQGGTGNTAIGYDALYLSNGGGYNTAIGYTAGYNNSSSTSQYNTYIGYNTDCATGTFNYSTAIGANAKITTNNQIVIGTSLETMYIQGGHYWNVGPNITGTITLALPLAQIYTISSAAAATITIPTPSSLYKGCHIIFKRTTQYTQVITIQNNPVANNFISYFQVIVVNRVNIQNSQYQTELICDGVYWLQINTS